VLSSWSNVGAVLAPPSPMLSTSPAVSVKLPWRSGHSPRQARTGYSTVRLAR
jgi:hypothetical protein